MTGKSPEEVAEMIRMQRIEWAKLDGTARYKEEMLKVVEAEVFNHSEGAMDARKMKARASERYMSAMREMVEARTKANVAMAEFKGLETKWETWRSLNATKRAETKIL